MPGWIIEHETIFSETIADTPFFMVVLS